MSKIKKEKYVLYTSLDSGNMNYRKMKQRMGIVVLGVINILHREVRGL
jgi:hypothetical protein